MRKLLLILITVSSGTLFAQPSWEWAKSSTSQGNDKIGTDLSADALSNIYSQKVKVRDLLKNWHFTTTTWVSASTIKLQDRQL